MIETPLMSYKTDATQGRGDVEYGTVIDLVEKEALLGGQFKFKS